MKRRYFGTDGIRGRVGQGCITPEFVLKLGWAVGQVLGNGPGSKVLIGKDTRISGYMFESALEAGLVAAGMDIHLLGPMPTPGIAYLTRTLHAQVGIVISASHNPHYDNGIKFFSGGGAKLSDGVELQIEKAIDQPLRTAESSQLGKAYRVEDAAGRYIEFCKSSVPPMMELRGIKVVLDCAHGATYHVAPHVFDELGAEVEVMGAEPNGLNINDGVGSTHPERLCRAVVELGADLGIAFDGDGDRVLMADHQGRLVDGDEILYIIARSRQADNGLRGSVVGTVMSNLGLEQALAAQGIGFERTKVGDRYILERLKGEGWALGGEPSGHIICLDRTSTGDGIVSGLQVLAEMQRSGRSLRELCSEMARYPQKRVDVQLSERRDVMGLPAVREAVGQAEADLGNTGRVLIRASGTEPLIRIMVEGREEAQVDRWATQLAEIVRGAA
jgi:phosphoglucosamine mutase